MKGKFPKGKRPRKPDMAVAEGAVPYRAASKSVDAVLRLTRFEIKNFRCFEALEIGPLSRVNLITGTNGIGKTTILEALFLHIGSVNPTLALRISLWRGLGGGNLEEWTGMIWRTLFRQFRESEPIRLVGTDSRGKKRTLLIKIVRTAVATTQDMQAGIGLEFAKDLGKELLFEYHNEKGELSAVRGIPEVLKRENVVTFQLRTDPPIAKGPFPGVFLNSMRQGVGEEEVQRFSDLRIRNQDHLILEVLKHMEPGLKKLEILSPHGASMIHAHVKGYEEPIPLSLLGDGVRRMASLMLAIGSARGGIVLVDEIENGIHHSLMLPLWEAIGRAAELFRTQVIATTHSLECVSAALEAFSSREPYDLTLHRLSRVDGEIRAIAYDDRESLEGALSIPTEVRG